MSSISNLIGIPAAVGKNRKFLLKNFNPEKIPENYGKEKFTEKIDYLKTDNNHEISWVKARVSTEGGIYLTLNKAKILDIKKGKRIKTRQQIHPDHHHNLLIEEKDPKRPRIIREVHCFVWEDRGFYVKTYTLEGDQGTLSFLVFNLRSDDEKVNFPDFLEVVRDVTEEAKYYSYNVTSPGYMLDEEF